MKAELLVREAEILQGKDYKVILTVPPQNKGEIATLQVLIDKVKDKPLTATIMQYRAKRSLDANAYFHLLIGRIAKIQRLGEDEVKKAMVLDYGTVARDEHGDKVGIKLPASVKVNSIYPYAKWFDERIENGRRFNCYIIYKQTRELDRAEMARLIEGVILEAKELGIETITPAEKERMLKMIKE